MSDLGNVQILHYFILCIYTSSVIKSAQNQTKSRVVRSSDPLPVVPFWRQDHVSRHLRKTPWLPSRIIVNH